MDDDRQSKIDQLVGSTLRVSPAERASFLERVCDDHELREAVTQVLNSYVVAGIQRDGAAPLPSNLPSGAAEFPDTPATADSRLNRSYGTYQVIRRIGAGGMGEVYLAFDTRLGRQVALKFLRAQTAADQQVVRRFQVEARTASALNHPNILTIFDIGRFDDEQYIASEYVDGVTLRSRLKTGRPELPEVLEITSQVASALVAAHSAGIVHRDLKPANIMLRPDGYVKVIDFGLAKRTPWSAASALDEALTRPGAMLGTVDYMSPEQVRGFEVDERSDIWSLGVILYEMLADRRPFRGDTEYHVLTQILDANPDPATAPGTLPSEVEAIVERCLQKDRAKRYPSAADLHNDLRQARRVLNLSVSTHSLLVSPPKARKHRTALLLALAVTAFAMLWWLLLRSTIKGRPESFDIVATKQLTFNGQVKLAAVSPNGLYLAYVTGPIHHEALWIASVDSTADAPRVAASDVEYTGIVFSPDSQSVFYVTRSHEFGKLFQIPLVSGNPRLVTVDVDGCVATDRRGTKLFFRRKLQDAVNIIAFDTEKRTETVLWRTSGIVDYRLAINNQNQVAFFVYPSSRQKTLQLGIVDSERRHVPLAVDLPNWRAVRGAAFAANQRDLIVAAGTREQSNEQMQLHVVSTRSGQAKPITNDMSGYRDVSLTADGNQLVAVRLEQRTRLWIASGPHLEESKTKATDSGRYQSIRWNDNGQLIAQADRGSGNNIWVVDLTGGAPRLLTDGRFNYRDPIALPGHHSVVFAADREGQSGIWRFDLTDASYHLLATAPDYAQSPYATPDGTTVVYTAWNLNRPSVWSVPAFGNRAAPKLLVSDAEYPKISPDGRSLAVQKLVDLDSGASKTLVLRYPRLDGAVEVPGVPADAHLDWNPASDALTYLVNDEQGVSNLWQYTLAGHHSQPLTNFQEDQIYDYSWAPQSGQLVCLRGHLWSDAVRFTKRPNGVGNWLASLWPLN